VADAQVTPKGSGNSRLVGGPEDNTLVDVAFPPAARLSRRLDDQVLHYDLDADKNGMPRFGEDRMMTWNYSDATPYTEPHPLGQVELLETEGISGAVSTAEEATGGRPAEGDGEAKASRSRRQAE
jgi:hypothetical protein